MPLRLHIHAALHVTSLTFLQHSMPTLGSQQCPLLPLPSPSGASVGAAVPWAASLHSAPSIQRSASALLLSPTSAQASPAASAELPAQASSDTGAPEGGEGSRTPVALEASRKASGGSEGSGDGSGSWYRQVQSVRQRRQQQPPLQRRRSRAPDLELAGLQGSYGGMARAPSAAAAHLDALLLDFCPAVGPEAPALWAGLEGSCSSPGLAGSDLGGAGNGPQGSGPRSSAAASSGAQALPASPFSHQPPPPQGGAGTASEAVLEVWVCNRSSHRFEARLERVGEELAQVGLAVGCLVGQSLPGGK